MPDDARLSISWPATALALVCLALDTLTDVSVFAYDRQSILAGEMWRLWTGHCVHFSTQQLFMDISSMVVAAAVVQREFGPLFVTRLLLLGAPALSIGLLLVAPDLAYYRGASGLAVMLAFVAGATIWSSRPGLRPLLIVLGLVFAAKAVLDATGFAAFGQSGLPGGVLVAWQAHVLGAGMGWASARLKLGNLQ